MSEPDDTQTYAAPDIRALYEAALTAQRDGRNPRHRPERGEVTFRRSGN